jgi:hypothetical protein
MILQTKDWVLIAGVVIACLGYECLPHGQEANAKLNTSLFAQSSAAGAFLSFGFLTLAFGLLVIFISFFVPRR